MDVWLKITGTREQAVAALENMGMAREMLVRNDAGNNTMDTMNHDVAMIVVDNLMTTRSTRDSRGIELTPAVFDGPHLMIRFVSDAVIVKWGAGGDIRSGLEIVTAPVTMGWAE